MYLARQVQLIASATAQAGISGLGDIGSVGGLLSHGAQSSNNALPLSALRAQSAWILLGEPGAGKSTLFKHEAEETGGKYYTVAEFLHAQMDPIDPEMTLFIDALDEYHERLSRQALLAQIATKLKQLGKPKFRIACRATDWWQSAATDAMTRSLTNTLSPSLTEASANHSLSLFSLLPLSESDVRQLLQSMLAAHLANEPHAFVNTFIDVRLDHLLTNPQTLQLLVKVWAAQASSRPKTLLASKAQIYELGCNQLAREVNPVQRDLQARLGRAYTTEQLLDMAGYLCAALMLSGYAGVSLDFEALNPNAPNPEENSLAFAHIDDLQPTDMNLALQAVCSRLFKPSTSSPDQTNKTNALNQHPRFESAHRSVAEYLAARWLSNQINQHGMPRQRLIRLLTGFDGKAISHLRGVYGWLAQLNLPAQNQLIEKDPLCVLLNTDIASSANQSTASQNTASTPSTQALMQRLFIALREEALKDPAPFWYLQRSTVGLSFDTSRHKTSNSPGNTIGFAGLSQAMLSQPEIYQQLLDDLTEASRNDHHQTWVMFLLKALLDTLAQNVGHTDNQTGGQTAKQTASDQKEDSDETEPYWAGTLAPVLRDITLDASRWEGLRKLALRTWLALNHQQKSGNHALQLLLFLHGQAEASSAIEPDTETKQATEPETETDTETLTERQHTRLTQAPALDPGLELTGILLGYLYPATIPSSEILRFCHVPVQDHLGSYQFFWGLQFAGLIPESDLPRVMDKLVKRQDLRPTQWDAFDLDRMLAAVMRRALAIHGNQIDAEHLYDWLRLGCDQYGQRWHQPHCHDVVHTWLTEQRYQRQDRYKDLLQVAYSRSALEMREEQENGYAGFAQALFYNTQFLQTVAPPHDIGAWHLDQVERLVKTSDESNIAQITEHLRDAIKSLWADQGVPDQGDPDQGNPDQSDPFVGLDITDSAIAEANTKKAHRSYADTHKAPGDGTSTNCVPTRHHPEIDQTKRMMFKLELLERLTGFIGRYPTVGVLMQGPLQALMSCAWPRYAHDSSGNSGYALQDAGRQDQAGWIRRGINKRITTQIANERAARTRELNKRLIQLPVDEVHPLLLNQLARLWVNEVAEFAGQDRRTRFAQYCDDPDEVMQAAQKALMACVNRADLPSATQIIEAASCKQHHPIGKACLVGMGLRDNKYGAVTDFTDETWASLVCWQLLDERQNRRDTPGWLTEILAKKPALVADVLKQSITTQLKDLTDHVAGVDQLVSDWRYGSIAAMVIPMALKSFPVRHKASQLRVLRQLIRGAMEYCPDELLAIALKKLSQKSPLPSQRVYWLLAVTLLQPETHEAKLWAFVGTNWERATEIGLFFEENNQWIATQFEDRANASTTKLGEGKNLGATKGETTIAKVIELLLPKADVEVPLGITQMTPAMQLGDTVRHLIGLLGELGTQTAVAELDRLSNMLSQAPGLTSIRHALLSAKLRAVTILRDTGVAVQGPLLGGVGIVGDYRLEDRLGAVVKVLRNLGLDSSDER
jgi:hypothetical protein